MEARKCRLKLNEGRRSSIINSSGVLSIGVGLMIAIFPATGVAVMGLAIGAYAFVLGVIMVTAAFRIHSEESDVRKVLHT